MEKITLFNFIWERKAEKYKTLRIFKKHGLN